MKDKKNNNKVILNFGCGDTMIPGAINIDHIKLPNVDKVFDFEKFPYPFKDKSVDEASRITNEAVAEALDGLPPNKMHCSVLAQEAIEAAIKNYREKKQ